MSRIVVDVVLALPGRQTVRSVPLPAGSTVEDAVTASGLAEEFRSLGSGRVGIFGKTVPGKTLLNDGDRVELYRPLRADPKDLRRLRAARKGSKP